MSARFEESRERTHAGTGNRDEVHVHRGRACHSVSVCTKNPRLLREEASGRMVAMKNLPRSIFALIAVLALFVFACGKPKQSEVPDADKDTGGADMAEEETAAKPTDEKPAPNEELRAKCCASCKEGLAADRSGSAPDTIPCADYTANLTPICLEFFRANPTKASECK